jgi:UDP-2,3-diacylglucosamine pyrophosphatase LpxH
MPKTKRYFISDVHLSSKTLYNSDRSWFKKPDHETRLIGFIDKHILGKTNIKDFILLGDIFNTWVCPADVQPPSYEEIFAANRAILDKFQEISKEGINLYYVNGNHDYDLTTKQIRQAISGVTPIQIYRSGQLHAEHGHRFDEIFNKPDYFCDPAFGRPLGYIISRLVTTFSSTGYGIIDLPTYLDDLVEAAATSQNLFESIIEGLAERAGMKGQDAIIMPGGTKLTIQKAKERYRKLGERYSLSEFVRELWDRSALGWQADRLCHKNDVSIVIFGHSHKALLDKDFFLVKDRIYANSGAWCKKNAYCVEVDKKPAKSIAVRLLKVEKDGTAKQKERQTLSIS